MTPEERRMATWVAICQLEATIGRKRKRATAISRVQATINAEIAAARPRWRPIDDTTPRGEGEWIWACVQGTQFPAITGYDEDASCWFTLNQIFKDWRPTHWMPLSAFEPPKEEK